MAKTITTMTKNERKQFFDTTRAIVDRVGWAGLRESHPQLWQDWLAEHKKEQAYVDECFKHDTYFGRYE